MTDMTDLSIDAILLAKSRLEELTKRVQELEEALQEILRVHADDNHRPKAFYIAASVLNKETSHG
jgi:hypothetical protein